MKVGKASALRTVLKWCSSRRSGESGALLFCQDGVADQELESNELLKDAGIDL